MTVDSLISSTAQKIESGIFNKRIQDIENNVQFIRQYNMTLITGGITTNNCNSTYSYIYSQIQNDINALQKEYAQNTDFVSALNKQLAYVKKLCDDIKIHYSELQRREQEQSNTNITIDKIDTTNTTDTTDTTDTIDTTNTTDTTKKKSQLKKNKNSANTSNNNLINIS